MIRDFVHHHRPINCYHTIIIPIIEALITILLTRSTLDDARDARNARRCACIMLESCAINGNIRFLQLTMRCFARYLGLAKVNDLI